MTSQPDQGSLIEFVDPETGEFYKVKPAKATVDAAYKLGFIPFTSEDSDRADAVDRAVPDEGRVA